MSELRTKNGLQSQTICGAADFTLKGLRTYPTITGSISYQPHEVLGKSKALGVASTNPKASGDNWAYGLSSGMGTGPCRVTKVDQAPYLDVHMGTWNFISQKAGGPQSQWPFGREHRSDTTGSTLLRPAESLVPEAMVINYETDEVMEEFFAGVAFVGDGGLVTPCQVVINPESRGRSTGGRQFLTTGSAKTAPTDLAWISVGPIVGLFLINSETWSTHIDYNGAIY